MLEITTDLIKNKKMKTIVALFMLFSIFRLSAQSNTVALGVEATGSGGTVSFTGGEVFYTYKSSSTGSVTEGVQQSYFAPSLGNYSDPSIATAGGNATVSPDAAPTAGASITAYTTTDFKGLLAVDQSTGVVTITNAHPAGNYAVTVDAGFGIIQTFTLTVGNTLCSQGQFYAPATPEVNVGSFPSSVAVGDFNGDGKQDIAVAKINGNNITIRLGDGQGGFSGTTYVAVGLRPESVAVGDFNGDGWQDIATACEGSNTVSIRLGDGQGGFSGSTEIAVGSSPQSVAIGDFNGDGKQDIATANYLSNSVSIRLGDGQGGFSGTTYVTVGLNPTSITVGDFNGDGKQDIAAANVGTSTVSIRLGDGEGGFSGTTEIVVGSSPSSVAVGDFNGDGNQDIVTADFYLNSVYIHLGDGQGGFSGATEITVGLNPRSLAVGDFNGDGWQDIAAANFNSSSVSIRLGDGQGGFSGNTDIVVGGLPYSVAVGDFNGDGHQDIASANNAASGSSVSIRLGGIGEINLQGNATDIVSGDVVPDLTDDTDFGTVVLNTPSTKTYTVQNTGTSPLTVNSIGISGTDASDFVFNNITLPATVPAGGETTFDVTFTTATLGTKTATVTISSNDCDESTYSFSVQGKVESYTVSFNSNGGTGTMSSQAIVYLASENLTVNSFI
ncbi:FG-GAP-like repeat-containing protein, partial [Winogradskyella sp.]|nr:FG-GAP-like repeat-containing protein [Winogradskyella sp.]